MSDIKEKRRHKRYAVSGIRGTVLYPSELNVIDISIDGAAIETTKRLELNREYTLKIKSQGAILDLKGRVVWSILNHTEKKDRGEIVPIYKAGIQFTSLINEKTAILLKFIEKNKIKTLERRVAGVRFKIVNPKDIKIDYPYRYDVKKLSLSGMLVEAEYPLDLNSQYDMELFIGENVLDIVGRVAYCMKTDSNYDIGIEFIKMSDNDKQLLKSFLNTIKD
jgi:hypothetical protein